MAMITTDHLAALSSAGYSEVAPPARKCKEMVICSSSFAASRGSRWHGGHKLRQSVHYEARRSGHDSAVKVEVEQRSSPSRTLNVALVVSNLPKIPNLALAE